MTKLLTTTERDTKSPIIVSPFDGQVDGQYGRRVPWFKAMLCAVGIHGGRWTYLIEGKCNQVKVCERCGKTKVRTKHQRQWQYIRNGVCEQDRVCLRCGDVRGHRTKHIWGEIYSVNWTKDGHQCNRCGEAEEWTRGG